MTPPETEGHRAAASARAGAVSQGSVGAGTGATVAKLLGPGSWLKGGVGTASLLGPNGLIVGALAVTNPVGNIVEFRKPVRLLRPDYGDSHADLPDVLERRPAVLRRSWRAPRTREHDAGVFATNVRFDHADDAAACVPGGHDVGRRLPRPHVRRRRYRLPRRSR